MREIEIERLLQWAYRDELPKRGLGDTLNNWHRVSNFGELLTVVDDEPGFPAALGFPHPDALTIERAVQGLRPEIALEWGEYRTLLMGDLIGLAPIDDPLAIMRHGRDAAMTQTRERRVFSEVALVETFARSGLRPRWNIGKPQPGAVTRRGVVVLVGECKDRDRYTLGSHCLLQYSRPSVDEVAFRRAEYLVWRGALDRLVGVLRGWTLRDWTPVKPDDASLPMLPWLDRAAPPQSPDIAITTPAWRTWADEPMVRRKRVKRDPAEIVPSAT